MKKILIINWRDPKSPLEGGAERFTLKFAEHWSQKGNQVFWLTNSFSGMDQKEIDKNGVNFIRISPDLDGSLLRYVFCYPIYLLKTILFANSFIKKENIDIVIDEIHGLPFFTPLYSKARNILLTCEVAGPIWDKMFPWPINLIGKYAEKAIYQIYKNTEILAISENTKKNILDLLPDAKVKIVDLGIDENKEILKQVKDIKKTSYPSAVFLARLVKMKGIETAIDAVPIISEKFPNFKLFVVGNGKIEYEKYLKEKVETMRIENNVVFLGFMDSLKKYEILRKCYFLFHPSYREGFGLTVIEAGLVGTPAIIRSGSSLDALVKNSYNGFVFNSDNQLANLFIDNYKTKNYKKIEINSVLNAKRYLWPDVLERLDHIIKI